MKALRKIMMAFAIFLASTTTVKAATVTETVATEVVPTIQPTISCTSTYLFVPQYCVHDVDADRDNQLTIFDLIRIKESIVYNPDNIYNVQDLLHLQYVLLNVQKPCLGGAPLMVTPTEEPIEEE